MSYDDLFSPPGLDVTFDAGDSTENSFDLDQSHSQNPVGQIYIDRAEHVNFYSWPEPKSTEEKEAEAALIPLECFVFSDD